MDSNDINEFLKSSFVFPSDNFDEIKSFIIQDKVLVNMIYNVPEIVRSEFPGDISLDFMRHVYPGEKILEIYTRTVFDVDTHSQI